MNIETVKETLEKAGHALANDEAAIKDITRLITNHEGGKRPYYIYDNVTGAKLGMSQLPVFEKRLEAFGGDILKMFAEYKGRGSKPAAEKTEKVIKPTTRTMKKESKETSYTSNITKMDVEGNPIEEEVIFKVDGEVTKTELRPLEVEREKITVE